MKLSKEYIDLNAKVRSLKERSFALRIQHKLGVLKDNNHSLMKANKREIARLMMQMSKLKLKI